MHVNIMRNAVDISFIQYRPHAVRFRYFRIFDEVLELRHVLAAVPVHEAAMLPGKVQLPLKTSEVLTDCVGNPTDKGRREPRCQQ